MRDRLIKWLLNSPKASWLIEPENTVLIHIFFGVFWLFPGSVITLVWLSSTVAWVSWMSLYAIVIGHWAGLQAALADLRVKEEDS
jgi:hypothetical protein